MCFCTFADVLGHLDRLGLFHMDLGLSRMQAALANLALSERLNPCPVVQIVGTNGKGSTASFLAELLKQHGLKAGLFTSPHLVSVRERIRVNGRMLPESVWPKLAGLVYAANPDLTYFEFLTVLAVLAFEKENVDCMILEAGLGGHYDATTAVSADIICFTPIALDHTAVLGPSLHDIVADKAKAMRLGKVAVTAPQSPDVLEHLKHVAAKKHCLLRQAVPLSNNNAKSILLMGSHQLINAGLAMEAWHILSQKYCWKASELCENKALATAFIPGRLQTIPAQRGLPPLLLDGGHNPHGLEALFATLCEQTLRPRAIVFSCMADKEIEVILPLVRRMADWAKAPLFVPGILENSRASNSAKLAAALGQATACPDVQAALNAAALVPELEPNAPILICGSLYLLGEVFKLYPKYLEPMVENISSLT